MICFTTSKNLQKKYQIRKEGCGLSYTLPRNKLKHGKLSAHMPQKRRDRNEPLYHAELKMFKCSFPNCSVSSKRKSNLKRRVTTCQAMKKRKHFKLTCPYCKVKFSQKFNRDRHVKNIHQEDTSVFVHNVNEADENTFNDLVDFNTEEPYENAETRKSHAFLVNENDSASQNNNNEILNASFISENGEVMDVKMSVIGKDTPIYQFCENRQVLHLMILKNK